MCATDINPVNGDTRRRQTIPRLQDLPMARKRDFCSMRDSLIIRAAHYHDAADVRACVVLAFERYAERMGIVPAPMLLDFGVEIETNHVWVAENEARVEGVLVQYETPLGFYVDTVAVAPGAQRKGVGKALFLFAEQEAVRRGYRALYLCTNAKMTENLAMYPRAGYVEYARKQESGYDRVYYRKALRSMNVPHGPCA